MSKTHHINKSIRIGAEFCRLGAESLRICEELGVDLETNYGLKPGRGFARIRSHAPALIFSLICACLSGCTIVSPSNSDDHVEFGDPYEIHVTNPSSGEPVDPHIDGEQLVTLVSYSGGCEQHEFELDTAVASDTASIWLVHNANGDLCEAYLTEERRTHLPECVLRAGTVILLDPDGESIPVSAGSG